MTGTDPATDARGAELALCNLLSDQMSSLFLHDQWTGTDLSGGCAYVPLVQWIVDSGRPRLAVDLGCRSPAITLALATSAERISTSCRVFAVSPLRSEKSNPADDLVRTLNERFSSFVTIVEKDMALPVGSPGNEALDLLVIDLSWARTLGDAKISRWISRASDRAVLLVHATGVEHARPRWLLDILADHDSFEFFHGSGMIVVSLGRFPMGPAAAILRAAKGDREKALRERLAYLGERWLARRNLVVASQQIEALKHAILAPGEFSDRSDISAQVFANLDQIGLSAEMVRHAAEIDRSPLFDVDFYQAHYPDSTQSVLSPALHFMLQPAHERRDPGPAFSSELYLEENKDVTEVGLHAIAHYLKYGRSEGRPISPSRKVEVDDHRGKRLFHDVPKIRVFELSSESEPSVSLLIDKFDPDFPYGGSAIGLIFAVELAARFGKKLKVITTARCAHAGMLKRVLGFHGISAPPDIELAHLPDTDGELIVAPDDIFIATSWKILAVLKQNFSATRLIALVQEDEEASLQGDDIIKCREAYDEGNVAIVVQGSALRARMASLQSSKGSNRIWQFEPLTFCNTTRSHIRARPISDQTEKRRLLVRLAPSERTGLYWRTVETLCQAVWNGALKPERWELQSFGDDAESQSHPHLAAAGFSISPAAVDWAALAGHADLAICLSLSPSAQDPLLGFVAAHIPVVTNQFGHHSDVGEVEGIFASPTLAVVELVRAISRAVDFLDAGYEFKAFESAHIDWPGVFAPAIDEAVRCFSRPGLLHVPIAANRA